jgi:hypothetical protein
VISSTAFTVKLPQSQIALSGAATQSQYGTQVWLVHAASRNLPQHAVAFKAITDGHLPAMHLAQKGTLYQYVPATNSWVHVSSVANSQIHAVVLTK